MRRRCIIAKCDDSDLVFAPDQKPRTHSWDVIDTRTGHAVCNVNTRREARFERDVLEETGDVHAEGSS